MPILTDQERCGTDLAGKYRIESILGRGGMGVVFRAQHLHTQRPVAIKILRPEFSQDHSFSKRFIREARAASSIRHPNVVAVLDLGIDDDSTIYQVLELLEGEALSDHLDRKGALSPARALEILLPIMGALIVAHEQGIVHRDLKPDNIFLARNHDGRVTPTLLDFGIAKLLDHAGSMATRTGSVMGTPHYMAPEQARGIKDQGVGIDIWAMGVLTFQCLTGQVPFDGSTPALVMLQIMTERAPRLDVVDPALPSEIAAVVDKALTPSIGGRYATMTEFVHALREAATAAAIELPTSRESTAGPISVPPAGVRAEPHAQTDILEGGNDGRDVLDIAAARAEIRSHDSLSETVAAKSSGGTNAAALSSGVEAIAAHGVAGTPVPPSVGAAPSAARRRMFMALAVSAVLALVGLASFARPGGAEPVEVAPIARSPQPSERDAAAALATEVSSARPDADVPAVDASDGPRPSSAALGATPDETPAAVPTPDPVVVRRVVRNHGASAAHTRRARDASGPTRDAPPPAHTESTTPSSSLPGVVEW